MTTPPSLRGVLLFSIAVAAITLLMSAYAWRQLPAGAQVPVHWNAAGEVDRYGSKFEGLMLTPLIAVSTSVLFYLLPRIDPRRENLLRSARAYTIVWGALMVMLLGVHIVTTLSVLGYAVDVGRYIPMGVGLLFIVIGNYLGKVRSNWFMGIRTPWTLSSELSWNKTHRLGGRMFVALGLLFAISGFLRPAELWVWLLIIGSFVMVTTMFVYSYLVWRNDPNARRLT